MIIIILLYLLLPFEGIKPSWITAMFWKIYCFIICNWLIHKCIVSRFIIFMYLLICPFPDFIKFRRYPRILGCNVFKIISEDFFAPCIYKLLNSIINICIIMKVIIIIRIISFICLVIHISVIVLIKWISSFFKV